MISRLKSFLRSVTRRGRLEAEMADEIQFHLEARATDLERTGLSHAEALRRARIEFGQPAMHIENMRHSLGLRWLDELVADIQYGARILRKSPGFTVIAVLSLGLAIGANTTIFSVANEMLYLRLGVPHPEQIRLLVLNVDKNSVVHNSWGSAYPAPDGGRRMDSFPYPVYQALRRDNHSLEEIFAFKDIGRANITANGTAQAVQVELVSGNLYEQIGVHPALGRAILPADDATPSAGAVAVISDSFWQRTFNRDPGVIGKVVTVNMTPVTIVGVNPRRFTGARSAQGSPELFMPLSMIPLLHAEVGRGGPALTSTTLWWVQLMARTRPGTGASEEQARAALEVSLISAIRANMSNLKPGDSMPRLVLEDGSKGLNYTGRMYASPMYVLLGMVGFVLLLACANIANLMLARASARQREMGVRLALGAGRWRILRQVLTESLMLSALGGALGLVLGYCGRTALPRMLNNAWDNTDVTVPFDGRVFAFTAAVTLLTGILFGLAPAWGSTRAEIGTALKEGGKSSTRRRKGLSGKAIVAFQVALSTLLVTAAVLFSRTLVNLYSVDTGFNTSNLVLFDINPPSTRYPAPKDVGLHMHLEEVLGTVPGVEGITLSDIALVGQSMSRSIFQVEGRPEIMPGAPDDVSDASLADVGPNFLSVMQIPLLAGRTFSASDTPTSPSVALINESAAKKFFPHENPIGHRFTTDTVTAKSRQWFTIIGICRDTLYTGLKDKREPLHFDLYRQSPVMGGATYMVRSQMKSDAIVPSLRSAIQGVDRDLPLIDIRTQKQQIDATVQQERLFAALTASFGVLALALACVGIYGIMAYTVSQRTNEIGIRLALGAERGQVRRMVLKETTWVAGAGVVAGLALALGLGRLVKSMLYGLKAGDPVSLAGSALLLIGVAMASGWIPALRASRVEPMEALRHE
jgi:predicted permease